MSSLTFQGPDGWQPLPIPIADVDFVDTLEGICLVHGYQAEIPNPAWDAWSALPDMVANPALLTWLQVPQFLDDGSLNPEYSERPSNQIRNHDKGDEPAKTITNPVDAAVFGAQIILNSLAPYADAIRKARVDAARTQAVPDPEPATPPQLF